MADVLCFGNLQFDLLCRTLTALPAPGELRMIDAIDAALSGNAGNVACVLARLGITVELAGYSGADPIGEGFRTLLAAEGVGTKRLLRHPTAGTGTSVVTLAPDGERSVFFVNGANGLFDLDAVPEDWLAGPRIISVGSVFVLPQFTGAAIARLFARAHAHGATTVLNPCWDSEQRGLPFLRAALAETDYFVLNADEGRQFTGENEPARILAALAPHVRGLVVLTIGADGCCLRGDDGTLVHVPALPVVATDCTGAGDSFVAGFIAGLLAGRSPVACARLACRVAAYAVTGPGAYTRVPRLAEIEAASLQEGAIHNDG